jgi:hypothetical protein
MGSSRPVLGWVAALLGAGAAIHATRRVWSEATAWEPGMVSDALPLYLSARAVRQGMDPTDPSVLQQVYSQLEMHVSMALFSTLYPASTAVLLSPIAGQTWPDFLHAWRWIILVLLGIGTAAAGAGSLRGWRAVLGGALGLWVAMAVFPTTGDALGLGQANLLIVGLFGLAIAGLARDRGGVTAIAAVLGAAIKLVPAIALFPLLVAKRWRALAWGLGAAGLLGILTLSCVSLERVIADLMSTIAFQRGVEAPWARNPATPEWIRWLGQLRRPSLGLLSLGLGGWAGWRARHTAEQRTTVLPTVLGLVITALAVDATAVGEFYATLLIPAMILLATWPLSPAAPRWSWALVPLIAAPAWCLSLDLSGIEPHPKLMLGGMAVWAGLTIRLLHLSRPLSRRAMITIGLLIGLAAAQSWIWAFRPPYMGPRALPPMAPGGHIPHAPPPPQHP